MLAGLDVESVHASSWSLFTYYFFTIQMDEYDSINLGLFSNLVRGERASFNKYA